jgi:hypothetical protein
MYPHQVLMEEQGLKRNDLSPEAQGYLTDFNHQYRGIDKRETEELKKQQEKEERERIEAIERKKQEEQEQMREQQMNERKKQEQAQQQQESGGNIFDYFF